MLYPEIKNIVNPCNRLIVLLHGLGSNGDDLMDLVSFMSDSLPNDYFIAPHGVESYKNYARQWFSVYNFDYDKLINNAMLLNDIIKKKQIELKLSNANTVIIGFSQGAMIGLYLSLIQINPFYSFIGFSGRLISRMEFYNRITPICLIHGELDDIIDIHYMYEIVRFLSKNNINCIYYTIPNIKHTIDIQGLQFAINFIKNCHNNIIY